MNKISLALASLLGVLGIASADKILERNLDQSKFQNVKPQEMALGQQWANHVNGEPVVSPSTLTLG